MSRKPATPTLTENGSLLLPAPARIAKAISLRLSGGKAGKYSAVRAALMEEFDISDTQAEKDIKAADLQIQKNFEAGLPVAAARVEERLWEIVDGPESGKTKVAALARLMDMYGLKAPKVIKLTGGVGINSPFSHVSSETLELLRQLAEAKKRAAQKSVDEAPTE